MVKESTLKKVESSTTVKYKNGNYGYSKVSRAIFTDGEKFYALAYRAYEKVMIDGKEYMEVQKVMGKWFVL